MKTKILYILFLSTLMSVAQDTESEEKSINDFNFESVTNPAFSLLDESPSVINTPDNLKSLSLYLSNGFSNTNIALETNPYWLLGNTDTSYLSYRGVKTDNEGKKRIDPFKGIQTNTTFSLAYLNKEFSGLGDEHKVFALGLRTSLFKWYNEKRTEEIIKVVERITIGVVDPISKAFEEYYADEDNTDGARDNKIGKIDCDSFSNDDGIKEEFYGYAEDFLDRDDTKALLKILGKENITKEQVVNAYFKERCKIALDFISNPKTIKPVIRLDGAVAYSMLFKENEINSSTANRFGSWVTLDIAVQLNDERYLHFFGIARYFDDGFNIDDDLNYFSRHFWDYGGKIQLELNNFKFSYEYLKRDGYGEQFRSVGNLTYQISEKMSITGGFGKDFPVEDNLVSILSINWGLDMGESPFSK